MSPSVRRPSSDPSGTGLQWYVVQVQSGREEAVRQALERRIRLKGLEDNIGRILIPVEKVIVIRNGRRVERTRKLFSGYLACEVVLDDRVLALFRETPGVTDFVRNGSALTPLSSAEVARMLAGQLDEKVNVILPEFEPGERIRVLRGAFAQMEGDVVEVLADRGEVRVRLTILGRPVELDVDAGEIVQLAGHE